MKIGKLILKYERKIKELKNELNYHDELTKKHQEVITALQKEYAAFVQNAGDKIQELKKQIPDIDTDDDQLRIMVRAFLNDKYFTIYEINYEKPVQPSQNPITNPHKVRQYPYQEIIVKIRNNGEPILP